MHYLLIVTIFYLSHGVATTTREFEAQSDCEHALAAYQKNGGLFTTVKGECLALAGSSR